MEAVLRFDDLLEGKMWKEEVGILVFKACIWKNIGVNGVVTWG